MTPTQQLAMLAATNCAVAFDNLTRQLYATDASIYQIEPAAVAFPREGRQASAITRAPVAAGAKNASWGRNFRLMPRNSIRWNPGGAGEKSPSLILP